MALPEATENIEQMTIDIHKVDPADKQLADEDSFVKQDFWDHCLCIILSLSIIFLMSHSYGIVPTTHLFISYINKFHPLGTHSAVDGQEDDFWLHSIILMNRNTRIFFITQIDTIK